MAMKRGNLYKELYNEILDRGYMLATEMKKRTNGSSYDSILANFEMSGYLCYGDTMKVKRKSGYGNMYDAVIVRPFEPLKREWGMI